MTGTGPGATAVRAATATLAVAAALVAAGCGVMSGGPPLVTVRGSGEAVDLASWTSCWSGLTGGGCSDGVPPADPPDVGAAEEVAVSFPEPGWTFTATFRPAGQPCARAQQVDLAGGPASSSASGGVIAPAGPAGTYDVDVSGSGTGGSVITTFRWTTPVDGPAPVPGSTIALLEERDGRVEGFAPSLAVTDLAAAPERASARVVVTSSEGASLALDPAPEVVGTCSAEGSVWFSGSQDEGERAAWPTDETTSPGEAASVPLRFAPPLPAPAS